MPLTTPVIVTLPPTPIAQLRLLLPATAAKASIGPAIHEIGAALASQSLSPAGPWLTLHFRDPGSMWDFAICEPLVPGAVFEERGRVTRGEIPGGRVAKVEWVGPYEGLPEAWEEFVRWMEERGVKPQEGPFWEVYVINPANKGEGEELRTELNFPIENEVNG